MSVLTIDCQYLYPRFAASFLIREGNEAAFVENNTAHSVPLLLNALAQEGMRPEQVRYLMITHVHLDHAGGSQALMKACPNAVLLAHPRAAPHVIDPSKLVASAKKVYGEKKFQELYGEIGPIPSERVRAMEDGAELRFGSRTFKFIHTRGHANHHFCVYDSGSDGVFTGDSFGLMYPDLQQAGLFIFPSTSPTDFDSRLARESIEKILQTGSKKAYLTHFGEVTQLREAASQLVAYFDWVDPTFEKIASSDDIKAEAEWIAECEKLIRSYFENFFASRNSKLSPKQWDLLKLDIELNAAGMVFAALKKKNASVKS